MDRAYTVIALHKEMDFFASRSGNHSKLQEDRNTQD